MEEAEGVAEGPENPVGDGVVRVEPRVVVVVGSVGGNGLHYYWRELKIKGG